MAEGAPQHGDRPAQPPADGPPADGPPADGPPADGPPGDRLPADLDVSAYAGRYTFPDISRRRIPGLMYLLSGTACFALWAGWGSGGVLVNRGFLAVAIGLAVLGAYHLAAGWSLAVSDTDALVAAVGEVGFPVGHASAQLGWRGLLSRPTWRILVYSAEEPPARRGLVLVDAVDGEVLGHYVEENPEDWSDLGEPRGAARDL